MDKRHIDAGLCPGPCSSHEPYEPHPEHTEQEVPAMTNFPNREHMKADQAARRRALKALDSVADEIKLMRNFLERGPDARVDAQNADVMQSKVHDLTGYLAELATLFDVREWDAADRAEVNQAVAETSRRDQELTGSEKRELGVENSG